MSSVELLCQTSSRLLSFLINTESNYELRTNLIKQYRAEELQNNTSIPNIVAEVVNNRKDQKNLSLEVKIKKMPNECSKADLPPDLPEKVRKSRCFSHSTSDMEMHELPWKVVESTGPNSVWSKMYDRRTSQLPVDNELESYFSITHLVHKPESLFPSIKLRNMVTNMDCIQAHQFVNNVQDGNWESVSLKTVTMASDALKDIGTLRKV